MLAKSSQKIFKKNRLKNILNRLLFTTITFKAVSCGEYTVILMLLLQLELLLEVLLHQCVQHRLQYCLDFFHGVKLLLLLLDFQLEKQENISGGLNLVSKRGGGRLSFFGRPETVTQTMHLADALSWWKTQVLLHHFSGHFHLVCSLIQCRKL